MNRMFACCPFDNNISSWIINTKKTKTSEMFFMSNIEEDHCP